MDRVAGNETGSSNFLKPHNRLDLPQLPDMVVGVHIRVAIGRQTDAGGSGGGFIHTRIADIQHLAGIHTEMVADGNQGVRSGLWIFHIQGRHPGLRCRHQQMGQLSPRRGAGVTRSRNRAISSATTRNT